MKREGFGDVLASTVWEARDRIGHPGIQEILHVKTQDLCVILEIKRKGRPNIAQVVEAGIIAKIDFIQQVLRDHFDKPNSICSHTGDRPDEQEQTNLAFIIDLNEKAFHIAKGPTCEHDFVKMDCSHLI